MAQLLRTFVVHVKALSLRQHPHSRACYANMKCPTAPAADAHLFLITPDALQAATAGHTQLVERQLPLPGGQMGEPVAQNNGNTVQRSELLHV